MKGGEDRAMIARNAGCLYRSGRLDMLTPMLLTVASHHPSPVRTLVHIPDECKSESSPGGAPLLDLSPQLADLVLADQGDL